MDILTLFENIEKTKEISPLVHNITNYVTIKECANIVLAVKSRPIMADSSFDSEEIQEKSDTLNINLGMMNFDKEKAIMLAGDMANKKKKPIILDPVGIGSSMKRYELCSKILKEIKPNVIKGNLSEILKLYDKNRASGGVDISTEDKNNITTDEKMQICFTLANKYKSIIIITGEIDIISDGKKIAKVYNGSDMMEKITGTGCQLSALIGAFIGANPNNIFYSCLSALILMGISGEIAFENLLEHEGNGSYADKLIDAIYNMDKTTYIKRGRYEIIER